MSTTRRDFLKGAAATGAALTFGAPGIIRARGLNEKLSIAFVGVGGMGGSHRRQMDRLGEITCCYADPDANHLKDALKPHPDAKAYADYRKMFDAEHSHFDAVMIGTPDHHHYPATAIAMQLGKHVFTQKPLTHTVWEARMLAKLAEKYPKLATQMGNQGHAGEGWRRVYEFIHSDAIGEVIEVHTWTNRPIWPQGLDRPEGKDPVPPHFDWDVWLGPAPERPYKDNVYAHFKWRGWLEFGAGALGDMACHTMDGIFWSLDPGYPEWIEPLATTPVNDETFPNSAMIQWHFGAKGSRRAFDCYWYDGGLKPARPVFMGADEKNLPKTGNLFVGTKGTILVSGDYGDNPRIIPKSRAKEVGDPPKMLPRSDGHYVEWVNACKGEGKALSNFAYAGPMTETILLGNVALQAGCRLEYDGEGMRFTNAPWADALLNKEYRQGWKY